MTDSYYGDDFTQEVMEEMCNKVNSHPACPGLWVSSPLEEKTPAESTLREIIDKGLVGKSSHLQQGISKISWSEEVYGLSENYYPVIEINEKPLQYPSGQLVEAILNNQEPHRLVGPMTGVFVHVFDKDLYAVHVRGKGISAPGKIQIVAGMGEFGVYPADLALKEVAEEIYGAKTQEDVKRLIQEKNIKPQFDQDNHQCFDVTPFMKLARTSDGTEVALPQLLFSYLITADLQDISRDVVKNVEDLDKLIDSLPGERRKEAYPFVVPINNLGDFLTQVDNQDRFYGPVKQTGFNFLNWYGNKN